jgi:hypothetical protein
MTPGEQYPVGAGVVLGGEGTLLLSHGLSAKH